MIDIRSVDASLPVDENINYNQHITDVLEQLIDQIKLEQIIDGDKKHVFRLRNIKRAIKLISAMPKITTLRSLPKSKGIGDGIKRRVGEILRTNTLEEVQNVNDEVRAVVELGKVHGVGPKMLANLYHNGIRSINTFRSAVETGVPELPVKVQTPTKIALRYHDDLKKRLPRELISDIERYLQDYIPTTFQVCGSYRRGAQTSGDIDILIMRNEHLINLAPLLHDLQEEGFLTAQLSGGHEKYNGICYFRGRYCRIDLLLTDEEAYYPALLHFTGSGLFNQIIRWHANQQGYKLSNLGLTWRQDPESCSLERKPVPTFTSEKDIFDFLGIRYLEPKERDI